MAKKVKKAAGKSTAKAARAKTVVKTKKAAARPAAKKAAKKPAPAAPKKAAPKKTTAAKTVKAEKPKTDKKPAARATAAPSPKPATTPAQKKADAQAALKASHQLNIFPQISQRPIAHKPVKATVEDTRTRYSDEELKEFEVLILAKLEKAREEFKLLKDTLNRNNDEGTDATSGGNTKVLEDGAETAEKENLSQLAARQQKYIANLENALVRIKNGTYGICSVTGKLISKERLIAVPHTTQSIEAKMMKKD
jgi:RNA polymerase-binding transcription factor DksA